MAKKIKGLKIIRVGKGSAKIIIDNKIKGLYYYQDNDGTYIVIDNLRGSSKMSFATLEELEEYYS